MSDGIRRNIANNTFAISEKKSSGELDQLAKWLGLGYGVCASFCEIMVTFHSMPLNVGPC